MIYMPYEYFKRAINELHDALTTAGELPPDTVVITKEDFKKILIEEYGKYIRGRNEN